MVPLIDKCTKLVLLLAEHGPTTSVELHKQSFISVEGLRRILYEWPDVFVVVNFQSGSRGKTGRKTTRFFGEHYRQRVIALRDDPERLAAYIAASIDCGTPDGQEVKILRGILAEQTGEEVFRLVLDHLGFEYSVYTRNRSRRQ